MARKRIISYPFVGTLVPGVGYPGRPRHEEKTADGDVPELAD
jgi:hypothetical protein